jgi:Mg-chelatase subunit ChlD
MGINTAVHLLVDASGSMTRLIDLASITTYSLCKSLLEVPDINAAVTAFPGKSEKGFNPLDDIWATVSPIIRHGETIHQRFQLKAAGTTPMAEALWWIIQQMAILRENRKIIFIVTDGEPDSPVETQAAIKEAKRIGIEIYGLGLGSQSIADLLPGKAVVINNTMDLPRKLFQLLGKTIQHKT